MKEKMALEFNRIWYKHDTGEAWIITANKAVEIISAEIEKVENPYKAHEEKSLHTKFHSQGFEDCRHKILTLLQGG